MPRKRKASATRAEGLRAAHEALSAKQLGLTPENSDLSGDSEYAIIDALKETLQNKVL
jgi:hypothetical protein